MLTYSFGAFSSPVGAASDIYVNADSGNDSNDGTTALKALATFREFYRRSRGGIINPPANALAFDAKLINVHIKSDFPATDPINLEVLLGLDVAVRYIGGVKTTVATGSFTGVADKVPGSNTAFEIEDTELAGTWGDHLGRRVRIISGPRTDTLMWVAKDLGAGMFRPSDPSLPAEYDGDIIAEFGELAPFVADLFPKTPEVGDEYAIEELFKVTVGDIHARGTGPGSAFMYPQVAFCELEIEGGGSLAPAGANTTFFFSQCKIIPFVVTKNFEEMYFKNCNLVGGLFSEGGQFATSVAGGLVGGVGLVGNGGLLHCTNDVMVHGVGIRGFGVCIQSACVFDAGESLSSSGHGVDVGRLQVHTSQPIGMGGSGITLARIQTEYHDSEIRLWGSGSEGAGVNVRSGCSFVVEQNEVVLPTIEAEGGDFKLAEAATFRSWDEGAGEYSAATASTWANLETARNAHNVAAAAHVILADV